jgi:hypothetical protein
MTAKIDQPGNRIPTEERPGIEAALAKKVPKVETPTALRGFREARPEEYGQDYVIGAAAANAIHGQLWGKNRVWAAMW